MWWSVAHAMRAEFEDWHSHEHFPERMSIPGFLRGSRWASLSEGDEGFFVMYELESYETLTSAPYLARLNDPTRWSKKMMPHHRSMVRSQCRVGASYGGGIAQSMATTRLSPRRGADQTLRDGLRDILDSLPGIPGITGAHLLQTQTPELATTLEQRIRGGADGVADWILLISAYDRGALADVMFTQFSEKSLADQGAEPDQLTTLYRLSYCMTPLDL
jgi:hypothetical protein